MEASISNFYLRILLISIVIIFWLYWLWTRRNHYRFALKIPRCWGLPLFGLMGGHLRSNYDFLPTFGRLLEKSGNTCCTWMGINTILLTCDPELMEKVLTSPNLINKSKTIYKPLAKALGHGLITLPAHKWHQRRKLINPSFQHKVLLSLFPFFEQAKQHLVKEFETLDDNQEHAIYDEIQTTIFSITFKTTMGTDMAIDEKMYGLQQDFQYLVSETINFIFLALFGAEWLHNLNLKYHWVHNNLISFCKRVMDAKIKKASTDSDFCQNVEKTSDENDIEPIRKVPNIFIDQAIQIFRRQQISYDDAINEANHIVIAAFETTANTLFSMITMLAMHPQVQDRLFEEIVSVYPDKDFQMDYTEMKDLPYFDMVLNEVMRIAPAVPVIARQVVEDTQIDEDLTLPKGLQILLSVFHLHRRKDIWGPDADKFNPDRFLPENMNGRHSYSFMPFSKGPRNCIGWRYALFSLKIMLVSLVRNFKFSTSFKYEDIEFIDNISILYKKYPQIKIERR